MSKPFPLAPAHPERNCWGCDQYCSVADLRCGNGSVRTPHPIELFGEDWHITAPPPPRPSAPEADPPAALHRPPVVRHPQSGVQPATTNAIDMDFQSRMS